MHGSLTDKDRAALGGGPFWVHRMVAQAGFEPTVSQVRRFRDGVEAAAHDRDPFVAGVMGWIFSEFDGLWERSRATKPADGLKRLRETLDGLPPDAVRAYLAALDGLAVGVAEASAVVGAEAVDPDEESAIAKVRKILGYEPGPSEADAAPEF